MKYSLTGFLAFILILFINFNGFAQLSNLQDINGKPLLITKYVNVEGSPFLLTDWAGGEVKLGNGKIHNNLLLKYDQIVNELVYKASNGEPFLFTDEVIQFVIYPVKGNNQEKYLFRKGYTGLGIEDKDLFYQVLTDGRTHLLKKNLKEIIETKEYSSASTSLKVVEKSKLFLFKDGKLLPIKKDKKFIIDAFKDKRLEIERFLKVNNLDIKQESSLVKIVEYFNTL